MLPLLLGRPSGARCSEHRHIAHCSGSVPYILANKNAKFRRLPRASGKCPPLRMFRTPDRGRAASRAKFPFSSARRRVRFSHLFPAPPEKFSSPPTPPPRSAKPKRRTAGTAPGISYFTCLAQSADSFCLQVAQFEIFWIATQELKIPTHRATLFILPVSAVLPEVYSTRIAPSIKSAKIRIFLCLARHPFKSP